MSVSGSNSISNKLNTRALPIRRGLSLPVFKLLASFAIMAQALLFACVRPMVDYSQMAAASVLQLIFLIAVLGFSPRRQSFCILFLVADWVFYCGQFACIAVGQYGSLNLDFRLYVSPSVAERAFSFYFYAQSLISFGVVLFQGTCAKTGSKRSVISITRNVSLALIAVGTPFRVYIDTMRLIGAFSSGYEGVYSLAIPSIYQAAAFFFDSGLLMLLLLYGKREKGPILFWGILVYKIVAMSTGARQEAFCFVVVWCFLYFCYVNRLSACRLAALFLGGIVLLYAIDAFGELRGQGFSFSSFQSYLSGRSPLDVVWDSLGEFGCAFTTLAVAVDRVPSLLDYGMGRSYLAGLLSVVPSLVGHFPALKASTVFTTSLPGTSYFGGSMLGELYYNFGWYGLAGSFLVGGIVSACQNGLNNLELERVGSKAWLAAVISVFMLLYIRGYFTDAIMKLVYTLLLAWIATGFDRQVHKRTTEKSSIMRNLI